MAVPNKVKEFLDSKDVNYQVLHHREAFTAQETAGNQHVKGQEFAKCVFMNVDGKTVMCVLSANHYISMKKFKNICECEHCALSSEEEMLKLYEGSACELGAEPPFKHFCQLPVYVDQHLSENKEIVCNGGTHKDLIRMSSEDFKSLCCADCEGDFCEHI
jgi:Ala-tRNA(Pro) deacylase